LDLAATSSGPRPPKAALAPTWQRPPTRRAAAGAPPVVEPRQGTLAGFDYCLER